MADPLPPIPTHVVAIERAEEGWFVGVAVVWMAGFDRAPDLHASEADACAAALDLADRKDLVAVRVG